LSGAVRDLDRAQGPLPRRGRKRATFVENELRAHIVRTGLPPAFRYEFPVKDDVTLGRRSIDYVLIDPTNSVRRLPVGVIEATCELKGPARPTVWKPGTKNYYDQIKNGKRTGIKPDVSKQHQLYKQNKRAEHYVFWVIESPDHSEHIDVALPRLLARLRSDLPSVRLAECARAEIAGLWMFLFRVS